MLRNVIIEKQSGPPPVASKLISGGIIGGVEGSEQEQQRDQRIHLGPGPAGGLFVTRAKKYIRVSIITAFFPGILFGIAMSLKIGFWSGITAGILFGVYFSILMSAISLPIDYFLTRNLPAKALEVYQNCKLQVKGDFEKVFEKCFHALKKLTYIRRIQSLKDEMTISARTKISNASWGEDIKLFFRLSNNNIINIYIYSSPVMKFTLLDYGKNFNNVEDIVNEITNALDG